MIDIREMHEADISAVVELQKSAFPPPFPADHLWKFEDLTSHIALYRQGQWVALAEGQVVGSCSNTLLSEANWSKFGDWEETVGGTRLGTFDPRGSTLFGLDISVLPGFRRQGIGRRFYDARKALVKKHRLARFGTGCRLPGFAESEYYTASNYAEAVIAGECTDRTLTPLMRFGLSFIMTVEDYWDDAESGNAAAILAWSPP